MSEKLVIDGNTLVFEASGKGPLVVLAHGIGDSRHSFRFVVPRLVAAGYRVANVDIRGCGDSSPDWPGYTRTDIASDLLTLLRHLGEPAVIIGHSISGGAATIAAASAPDLIKGVIELAPFTRDQSFDLGGLLQVSRYRRGYAQLAMVIIRGRLKNWMRYLDIAYPKKPGDWVTERARIESKLREPRRMGVLQAMCKTPPSDAAAQLAKVKCPVLIVEGSLDPDWADPKSEGQKIIADLPRGLGELVMIEGAGHYLHAQTPEKVVEVTLPFLAKTLPRV